MPHTNYTRLMAKPRTSSNDAALRAECAITIDILAGYGIDELRVLNRSTSIHAQN